MTSVIVAHPGAREHYVVSAMARREGVLARLITDLWNPFGETSARFMLKVGPPALARLAQRRHECIPNRTVVALNCHGIRSWLRSRLARDHQHQYSVYESEGRRFALATCRHLDIAHTCYFGYSGASLEALELENRRGIRTIVDQIDAAAVAEEIRIEEESKYRDLLRGPVSRIPASYFQRLRSEWGAASAVVVNSEWSRKALEQQGVPGEKIFVIPLAYLPRPVTQWRRPRGRRLNVLWLGRILIMKGIVYALQAARELERANVHFTFAGQLDLSPSAMSRLPSNATYIGPVSRMSVAELFQQHDVFLFPTLSDGFGMVQLEAMSYGLPVIATDRCGSVVQNGESGYLVRAGDVEAIVGALLRLTQDRGELLRLSENALARSSQFRPEFIWQLYRQLVEA